MTVTNHSKLDDIRERVIALTRDLILIPSIASRPEDLKRCFALIKNHLESLKSIHIRTFEDSGIPSLVATPPNCDNPEILICAHIDVISHPDISLYQSAIKNNRIYGPGAGDMKGSVAIALEVFRNIHSQHPNISLGIAITADEEIGGSSGIGYLFNQAGISCSTAMIPDGGALNAITVEEKGILHMELKCHGHSAHAARPWLGHNPIEQLITETQELKTYFNNLKEEQTNWYPTCALTIFSTENQTINRIPTLATAVCDIRFPPPHTVESIMKKIKELLSPDIEIKIFISAEATHLSPDPLYQKITEQIIGKKTELVRDDGGSDARYLADKGIPVLISRPTVGNLHAEDEWIDIPSMVQFYQIYEEYLLKKLIQEK